MSLVAFVVMPSSLRRLLAISGWRPMRKLPGRGAGIGAGCGRQRCHSHILSTFSQGAGLILRP